MSEYIKAYEYESNVNPTLNPVPIVTKNIQDCTLGINFIDNGPFYNVDCKATSPNLLASFIVLDENKGHIIRFNREDVAVEKEINASSHLFYVLNGKCRFTLREYVYVRGEEYGELYTDIKDTEFVVERGEIFICPAFQDLKMTNMLANEKTEIYYVNDTTEEASNTAAPAC